MFDPHAEPGLLIDNMVAVIKDGHHTDPRQATGDISSDGLLGMFGEFSDPEPDPLDPLEGLESDEDEQQYDYSLVPHGDNLAEYLEESELQHLALDLQKQYKEDKESRASWEQTAADGMELLGLEIKKAKDEPFKGASSVIDPVITEAIIKFQSNAVQEIFGSDGPVEVKIWGKPDDIKRERATRKKDYMNHVLTTVIDDYREETEKLLWDLAYCGSAFRKIYPNTETKEPEAQYFPAERVIIPYNYPNLWKAPRYSCIINLDDTELHRLQKTGVYRDAELGHASMEELSEVQSAKDEITKSDRPVTAQAESRTIIEMYCRLNLPHFDEEDAIASPYIVTFEDQTSKVLAIRRNWKEGDEKRRPLHWMVQYTFIPGPGSYGFGYIHLIGNLAKASSSMLRLLMDSGVMSSFSGGLVQGLRTKDGVIRVRPNEYQNCEVAGLPLNQAVFPMPAKEPSQVLAVLRDGVKADAKNIASIADPDIAANGEVPVGTIIALLQEKQKVMTAIQARLHRSLKKEFAILDRVIQQQLSDSVGGEEDKEYPYEVMGGARIIKLADFKDTLTCQPVSDPNMSTFSLQFLKLKYALEISAQAPGVYDLPKLHKAVLNFLNVKDVDEIIPDKEHIPVRDPRSEVSALLQGEPIKAFPWQDHQAHFSTLMSFINDPMMKQQLGGMPQGSQIFNAANAAIAERMAYIYSQKIEKELGITLPPLGEPIPPEIEMSLSGAIAQAASRVAQNDAQQAAQQAAQQQAQDPLTQIQRGELEVKKFTAQANAQAKQAEIVAKAKADFEDQQTKRMKIQNDANVALQKTQGELQWIQSELQKINAAGPMTQAQVQEMLAKVTKTRAETALILQEIAQMKAGGSDGTIQ